MYVVIGATGNTGGVVADWGTPISTFWRWRSGARESYIHSF
jgi:hypothetical protein